MEQFTEYFQRLSYQIEETSNQPDYGDEFPWSKLFNKPPFSLTYKKCQPLETPEFEENKNKLENGIPLNPIDKINQYNRTDDYFIERFNISHSKSNIVTCLGERPWFYYRNNLTTTIQNWLVLASGQAIYIYDLNTPYSNNSTLPYVCGINIILETASENAVNEAIMPNVRNTINYITYDEIEDVLLIADDFSRVVVIDVSKLKRAINGEKFEPLPNNIKVTLTTNDNEYKVSLGYYVITKSSTWGLKLYNKILYVSDNSHRITSYQFTKHGAHELNFSQDLLDNIPSIDVTSLNSSVIIACTTIAGFIYILDSNLNILDRLHTSDTQGWLCKFIPKDYFLTVTHPQYLTDDGHPPSFLKNIIAQSKSLNDFHGLGIAANIQNLTVPTYEECLTPPFSLASNQTIQLNRHLQFIINKPNFNDYLFIATRTQIGLFDPLLNNLASTPQLFPLNHRLSKLNLSCDLPKLNAIVVADSTGFVALIRFTTYNGIKAYRVERFLLETIKPFIIGLSSTITGYDFEGNPEYAVIITHATKDIDIFHITNRSTHKNLDIYTII